MKKFKKTVDKCRKRMVLYTSARENTKNLRTKQKVLKKIKKVLDRLKQL